MALFLIEVVKLIVKFAAACVCIGIAWLVFVIVREVAWLVQQENRKQYREKQQGADRQQD